MTDYQCCSNCTTKWIFITKDNLEIGVCSERYSNETLREISKGAYNVQTGEYQDFTKMEVPPQ